MPPEPQGVRLGWDEIPRPVRDAIDGAVGSPVVEAANQPGGFSPGLAARCRLADGRRLFVKAVSPAPNPQSFEMLRHEAAVTKTLPEGFPSPRVLTTVECGDWLAVVFEDVDGRCPHVPWTEAELDAVVAAMDDLADRPVPAPDGVPGIDGALGASFAGWRTLAGGTAAGDVDALDPWVRRHLDRLAAAEEPWAAAAAGPSLIHVDIRADNVLLAGDRVVFVDWANAAAGAHWVDVVLMAPSVGLHGGPSPASVLERSRLVAAVDPEAVTAVAVALTGYFVRQSLEPPPPGLPTVRAFQAAQGEIGLAWLRERTGWG